MYLKSIFASDIHYYLIHSPLTAKFMLSEIHPVCDVTSVNVFRKVLCVLIAGDWETGSAPRILERLRKDSEIAGMLW